MENTTSAVDVTVSNAGTVFLFTLHTEVAREWVTDNVQLEGYQWMGASSFGVEHRFAEQLASGMQGDGLTVE